MRTASAGRVLAVFAAAWIFLCCGSSASASADLAGGRPSLLDAAEAAPGTYSFAQVRSGRVPFVHFSRYKRSGWPVSIWLRFSVSGSPATDRERWLITVPRTVQSADLYRTDGSVLTTGMFVPFERRPETMYVPAFRIETADYNGPPLYLHLVYYPDVPFAVRLISERAFFQWNEPFRIVEGLFVGVLLAVALFNLFLFGTLRDRSALLYVFYVIALILNEIATTGIGEQYLWPALGLDVRLLSYATNIVCFAAFLFFARSFLLTREEARPCDVALIAGFVFYAAIQIAQVVVPGGQALVPAVLCAQLLTMIITIAVGTVRLFSGYGPARFFLIAFVPATIGVFSNFVYDAFMPPGNWFLAENGVEFGTMLQSIVLTFSVIERLRLLQTETRRTRTELTAVSAHAKKMQALALFDPLTGLSNRVRFNDELQRAIARRTQDEKKFAVLFCDLDGFKGINDVYGHRFGDDVLRIVASRLTNSLRGQDLIARLGGDEFAVLLDFVPSLAQADHVANVLAHLLDEPIVLESNIMPIGISVGRAVFPDDGRTLDALLHLADQRMYQMKQSRKLRSVSS
ncbi:MAG TPA: diguanylate cyclase [Candidatus Baltobacteraceae bacterium]|nr:diguanylate cyclase [Candidatus Baltobacteraceae bacterium]